MQKPKKVALKIVSISAYVVLVAYMAAFLVTGFLAKFGDISGYGFLVKGIDSFAVKHFEAIPKIFTFGLPGSLSGIIMSVVSYLSIAFVIFAVMMTIRTGLATQRLVCLNGMVAAYFVVVPTLLTAGGFAFHIDVINKTGVYAEAPSITPILSWVILVTSALYIVLAVATMILSFRDAKKYPYGYVFEEEQPIQIEKPEKEEQPEPSKEDEIVDELVEKIDIDGEELDMTIEELEKLIRRIVREELADKDKKEEPVEEVIPEAAPVEEPVEEVEEVEETEVGDGKTPIVRIPFANRMAQADEDLQATYADIRNEILSYGAHSRLSNGGDSFRLHRKTYVKVTIAGKSLKLYFALDPKDYAESKLPISDAGHKATYAEIPLVFKVKSSLSVRRAKQLIFEAFAKDNIKKGNVDLEDDED